MDIEKIVLNFEGRDAVLFGYANDYFFQNVNDHLHGAVIVIEELRKLSPGSVVVDVGANIGTSALSAAYIIPGCQIISFEPSPRAIACLRRTIEANDLQNVDIVEAAVGARNGRVSLAETEFLAGTHMLGPKRGMRDPSTVVTPVVTLDKVLLRQKKIERLDLLKTDVEGFELDVIDGAMKVIEKFRPRMVIEYSAFGVVVNADGSPLRLIERMLELAGEIDVKMPWGDIKVIEDSKSIKDFIFANMRVGAQDIAISVKPDFKRKNFMLA